VLRLERRLFPKAGKEERILRVALRDLSPEVNISSKVRTFVLRPTQNGVNARPLEPQPSAAVAAAQADYGEQFVVYELKLLPGRGSLKLLDSTCQESVFCHTF
jgi:hypothetical protein